MKAFKVRVGYETDFYGYSTKEEIAEYFFNEEDAKRRYKEGEYVIEETQITTTFKDGTESTTYTHRMFFEQRKAKAEPNERVELVNVVRNNFVLSEIEIN
jgi:hypothetical protein